MQLPASVAADHLDVFFAPACTAPLRLRVPTVVTIHDVSFAAHPEWFRRARRRAPSLADPCDGCARQRHRDRVGVLEAGNRRAPRRRRREGAGECRKASTGWRASRRRGVQPADGESRSAPALRRIDLQSPSRARSDSSRGRRSRCRRRESRSTWSARIATFPLQDIDRAIDNHRHDGPGALAPLRDGRDTSRSVGGGARFAFLSEYERTLG